MKMDKKAQIRFNWGTLDIIAAIFFLLGIMVFSEGNQLGGWILIILAFIKQFSGR